MNRSVRYLPVPTDPVEPEPTELDVVMFVDPVDPRVDEPTDPEPTDDVPVVEDPTDPADELDVFELDVLALEVFALDVLAESPSDEPPALFAEAKSCPVPSPPSCDAVDADAPLPVLAVPVVDDDPDVVEELPESESLAPPRTPPALLAPIAAIESLLPVLAIPALAPFAVMSDDDPDAA